MVISPVSFYDIHILLHPTYPLSPSFPPPFLSIWLSPPLPTYLLPSLSPSLSDSISSYFPFSFFLFNLGLNMTHSFQNSTFHFLILSRTKITLSSYVSLISHFIHIYIHKTLFLFYFGH